jgi:hypothetical protein
MIGGAQLYKTPEARICREVSSEQRKRRKEEI